MNNREQELIHNYWSKTDFGKQMILSDHVSYSDLLFMIPNNVKRKYGLPVTRTCGKRKSYIKLKRKRNILRFKLFDLLEETIYSMLPKEYGRLFFDSFVDFKNFELGNQNYFEVKPYIDVSLTPSLCKPLLRVNGY